jgi:Rrf2 family iron-sulfur cluster assembly transcriptional regulator
MTQELWASLHTALMAHMKTITLAQLATEQRAKGVQVPSRKPAKKGILQKPARESVRSTAPNSVFALAQVWPAKA